MLLGRDLFDANVVRLDLRRGTVDIGRRARRAASGCRSASIAASPTVPAAVEGHDAVQTVFDTGNGTEVLVGRAYAGGSG